MRGVDTFTEIPLIMGHLEDFVQSGNPVRPIRQMVNEALVGMDAIFAAMYESSIFGGRPSIPPPPRNCCVQHLSYSLSAEQLRRKIDRAARSRNTKRLVHESFASGWVAKCCCADCKADGAAKPQSRAGCNP